MTIGQANTDTEATMGSAQDVADVILRSRRILVVSHLRPDGDCLGSATALLAALRARGIEAVGYNETGVLEKLRFIPNSDLVSTNLPDWTPDTTIFVDCGGVGRVSPTFQPQGFLINIDHHATNEQFGDLNWIDVSACAVGEQIHELLGVLGAEITPEIAYSLYVSICADTGSFRFPNTNARTFELAAELTKLGADPAEVCRNLFESRSRGEILLSGRALARIRFDCDGKLAWSELLWPDYAEAGGVDHEPDGLSTELRSIEGVEVAILFHEVEGGGLRAGFRGKGGVDCAALAQRCGGGGHRNASGYFNDQVDYEAEREKILGYTQEAIKKELGVSAD